LASAWVRIAQAQAAEVVAAHTASVEAMIPAPVCITNRTTQAALVATNAPFGQNTPAILMLDAEYGQFWIQNATQRTGYGAVVSTALGFLAEPGPFSPTAANPAGPALGAAQSTAQSGMQGALQASSKTMQAAEAPAQDAMAGPGGMASSMAGQFGGMVGQVGSVFGQVTEVGQQLPQMLGQAPQMFTGLLGPLSSMNGATAVPEAVGAIGGAPMAGLGGVGAIAGVGGGGGGGLVSGSSALSSTFVKPAGSFSSPTAPTLPAGWQGGSSSTESGARSAGAPGGGLYGAPPAAMGQGSGSDSAEKSSRTMQVTARPSNRGERERI
jgi:PPE-repeat protein